MKFSTNTEVADFNPEQQDALLAEMQADALRTFQAAATVTDRGSAMAAFAHAAQARESLMELIGRRRRFHEQQTQSPS